MGTSLTGAPTARDAASMFMGAVKSQDLQAMGAVWGSEQGAARDHMEREELDKRLVLLQQCYDHDRFQLLEESIGQEGTRQVRVQVTRGTRTRTPNFKLIQGPSDRWYVADTDFPTVQEFCRPGNSAPSR
jgi:hypothetical protein